MSSWLLKIDCIQPIVIKAKKKKDAAAERFLQDGRGTAYPLDEEMGLQNTVLAWPQDTKAGQAIIHVAYVASSHAVLG